MRLTRFLARGSMVPLAILPLAAAPMMAQSTVSLENDSIVLVGSSNVVLDVDGNDMILGRADAKDASGFPFDEDIDLVIVDAFNDVADLEPSFYFNADRAGLTMGSGTVSVPGEAGRLFIEDGRGTVVLDIDGVTGNINQDFDFVGGVAGYDGNGAVKAWAILSADGTVRRCWNCVTGLQTGLISEGEYEVDFIFEDVSARPALAAPSYWQSGCFFVGQCPPSFSAVGVTGRNGDTSSFYVITRDPRTGDLASASFTLVVF